MSAQNESIIIKSFYDSLSFALGVENASGLLRESRFDPLDREMLIDGFESNLSASAPSDCEATLQKFLGPQGMDFDTAYLKDGSRCIGRFIGNSFYNQMTQIEYIEELDISLVQEGFKQGIYSQHEKFISGDDVRSIIMRFGKMVEQELLGEINHRDKLFWERVLQIEGLKQVEETGIYFEIIEQGNGGKPTQESDIEAHYILTNAIGDTLESSYERGQSLKINLQAVILGWKEGFPALEKGGKYRLFVPYEKAYKNGRSEAPQGALCFYIEFIDFGDSGTIALPSSGY